MKTENKVGEPNQPTYFTPKNVIITGVVVITATVATAALGAFVVFFVNYFGIVQGFHALIAYASVGAGGGALVFAEFVGGIIVLTTAYKRNAPEKNAPPKSEPPHKSPTPSSSSTKASSSSEDKGPPVPYEEADVPNGELNKIKADIVVHMRTYSPEVDGEVVFTYEPKNFDSLIKDEYNNPTLMDAVVNTPDKPLQDHLLKLIQEPINEYPKETWMPNHKLFNAIRRKPEGFKEFAHHFLKVGKDEDDKFPVRLLYDLNEEEKLILFMEIVANAVNQKEKDSQIEPFLLLLEHEIRETVVKSISNGLVELYYWVKQKADEDIPEGDSAAFKNQILAIRFPPGVQGGGIILGFDYSDELKAFILANYNNPTAMDSLAHEPEVWDTVLGLIQSPLKENSYNDWTPNNKFFNAIRRDPDRFNAFLHHFLRKEPPGLPPFFFNLSNEEKEILFREIILEEQANDLGEVHYVHRVSTIFAPLINAIESNSTEEKEKGRCRIILNWIMDRFDVEFGSTYPNASKVLHQAFE